MLVPAIRYKTELETLFSKEYGTERYFFYMGCRDWYPVNIADNNENGNEQFACIDSNGVVNGYFAYRVDYFDNSVFNFGLYSFVEGNNFTLLEDLDNQMENLVKKFHRVEYRCISGNHVERAYDRFCQRHKGRKHVFRDVLRDSNGQYHDELVYEIINYNNWLKTTCQ